MYCMYLRKSRADLELEARGEMETLARHKRILLELARSRRIAVGSIYEELVSGESIAARPAARQLLEEVGQGVWEGVLVMEVERLARGDTIDQGVVARAFRVGRAKIVTPMKTYDPSNEFDEEYFEFGLFMSRREYKAINRRIQTGRVESAREGKFIGSVPPYGYDKIPLAGDKGYTLAEHPEEAAVIRAIFDRYSKGDGMDVIAQRLDAMGIPPRRGGSWSKSSIGAILSNPVYAGKIRWAHRTYQKYIQGGEIKRRRVINDTPILVRGLHPALLTQEEFDAAQIMREKHIKNTTKKDLSLKNPLTGLIVCQSCGGRMTRLAPNQKNPHASLRCPNRNCKNISAPICLVEQTIACALRRWLQGYELELSAGEGEEPPLRELERKAIRNHTKELETLRRQISRAHDLLEQGIYTAAVFSQRREELARREGELEARLWAAQTAWEEQEQLSAAGSMPRRANLWEVYTGAEGAREQNDVLRQLLGRVEYRKDTPNTRGKPDQDPLELHLFPKLAGKSP